MSGERASRSSLDLPGKQEQLLEAAVATGKPIVLVLLNARPLNITWASTHVPAILEAWYPGTEGGNAIADLLSGDANPGGKLPVAWPLTIGQIPINYARNLTQIPEAPNTRYWDGSSAPLYPFGYGLSYSTFTTSNLHIAAPTVHAGSTLNVSIDVQNTSNRAGDEVVQLYTHQRAGSASPPRPRAQRLPPRLAQAQRNPHHHPPPQHQRPRLLEPRHPPLVHGARHLRPLG